MLSAAELHDAFLAAGIRFFTGVPDSQLKAYCDHLASLDAENPAQHIIAANEGGAVGLAAGSHLATGGIPLVYMQNSGLGNAVNPLASLTDPAVYGIPLLLLVGWRGKPGVKDEPQHVKQGMITPDLLALLGVETHVLTADSTVAEIRGVLAGRFANAWQNGRAAAIVVEKGALTPSGKAPKRADPPPLSREAAIQHLAAHLGADDFVVSTTGKASRELYEFRQQAGGGDHDFLTVGSMGHASMIALALAEQGGHRVFCLDGDGAVLMHMGAMALIGARKPARLVHVALNNAAHESVGGMPTVAEQVDLCAVAKACGYATVHCVETLAGLDRALDALAAQAGPHWVEIRVNLDVREDLGRPKSTPRENKEAFMARFRQGAE